MKEILSDKIWFTRKARIQTTQRLKSNYTHSQLLLIEYSFISVVLSIIAIRYSMLFGKDTDILLAIISVLILILSLVITNFNMKERSEKFFDNYTNLDSLYLKVKQLESDSTKDDGTKYDEAYDEYAALVNGIKDNHSTLDDICARVENAEGLTSRLPSISEYLSCYTYKIVRDIFCIVLYLAPILGTIAFYMIQP